MAQEALIIGAGFAGAVCARRLADKGYTVTLLEKRGHIAGNMYDEADAQGIRVHWYGPHIFHTSIQRVWEYLNRFTDFFPYEHRVLGWIDGQLVPIPFNYASLEALRPEQAPVLEQMLSNAFPGQKRISILDLLNRREPPLKELGEYIYDRVFVHYTAKQWQLPIEQVDRSVINRVPVVLGYDDRYFQDTWQAMPAEGYLPLFQALLDSPSICVCLNCDGLERLTLSERRICLDGREWIGPVIYTGPLDELFRQQYGPLPYRSLELVTERYDREWFQPAAVVNYSNEEDFTRITEHKYLTGQVLPGTTIMKEYPLAYVPEKNLPYYPIASAESEALYQKYRTLADGYPRLHLCGRLAEYRYYNMDGVISRALELSDAIQD